MRLSLSKTMVDVQWAFFSIVTASLTHFILRIALGRELGAEGLGVYTLAFTIYLIGVNFAAFGIGSALTKYIAEFLDDDSTTRKYISSGMTGSIITGALMGIVLYLLASIIANTLFRVPELEWMIQLTALCFPFIAIQKAVLGTLNGFRRMNLFALVNVVQNVLIVIVSLVLVSSLGRGVDGAVVGFVGPTILLGVLSPILIRKHLALDASLWYIPALRGTLIFGFFIVLGNSISFLNTQLNNLFIGYYLTPTEVGIFSVSVLLAQTLTLIPSAVQSVTLPMISTLYGKGQIGEIRKVIKTTTIKVFIISIFIAGFLAITGQYLITLLFKGDFLAAYIPLLILLIGQTVFSPFMAIGATLASIGKVQIPFRIGAVCLLLNIMLNILLIPTYGINGAALATTLIMIINFGINVFAIHWYLK